MAKKNKQDYPLYGAARWSDRLINLLKYAVILMGVMMILGFVLVGTMIIGYWL